MGCDLANNMARTFNFICLSCYLGKIGKILWVFGKRASELKSSEANFLFFVMCLANIEKHLNNRKKFRKKSLKV